MADIGVFGQRRHAEDLEIMLEHVIGRIQIILTCSSPDRHVAHTLEGCAAHRSDLEMRAFHYS